MKRNLKSYTLILLKGIAMGMADVVPGVSGGTIAFIVGIYQELLSSIAAINLNSLKTLKNKGFKSFWESINGSFLLSLLIGILVSIVVFASIISYLLENHSILVWSFFFGLVLSSSYLVLKQLPKWNFKTTLFLIIGMLLAYFLSTLQPLVVENSSNWMLFFAGALAICAMILPGISGSFILLLLGAYKPVLDAVNNRDFEIIAFIASGAIVGLLSFSKLLKWLFDKYNGIMLALLSGFIIGSLNKIWPWRNLQETKVVADKIVVISEQRVLPANYLGDPQFTEALLLMAAGFIFIFLVEKLSINLAKKQG
jgi:putative membrane protein